MTDVERIAGQLPEGWIEHDGGPCPVPPESNPDVMFRNGIIASRRSRRVASDWMWVHHGTNGDIIAYKPESGRGSMTARISNREEE